MQMLTEVNQMVGGILGYLILATVFIVVFVNLKMYEAQKALPPAAFVTAILSLLLSALGILPGGAVIICWLVFALSLFLK